MCLGMPTTLRIWFLLKATVGNVKLKNKVHKRLRKERPRKARRTKERKLQKDANREAGPETKTHAS